MDFDKRLIAGKLRRWERYLDDYTLPPWDDIPDNGLYMGEVISLLKTYLDYMPPELKEEQFITAAAINNYVRKRVMPEPVGRKYYRVHIVYLIMICSLKQCLSIPTLQTMLPRDLTDGQLRETYVAYTRLHREAVTYFTKQVRLAAGGILDHGPAPDGTPSFDRTDDLITVAAVISGFARLMAEKLLLLEGRTLENGGSIELLSPGDHGARRGER